jgi:hypothetical protein
LIVVISFPHEKGRTKRPVFALLIDYVPAPTKESESMLNVEEALKAQAAAMTGLMIKVEALGTIVATIMAEVASEHPDMAARLEQIIACEEGAATAAITEEGLENPTLLKIYQEKAEHRNRVFSLARAALGRISALRLPPA